MIGTSDQSCWLAEACINSTLLLPPLLLLLLVPNEAMVVGLQGGSAEQPPSASTSKGKSSGIVIGIGVAVALAVLGEPCFKYHGRGEEEIRSNLMLMMGVRGGGG